MEKVQFERAHAGCRTGEAKLTKGFNLAARFIIHTVGPKYKAKYRTAGGEFTPVYKRLLPLYYPRSEEEERACLPLIPADIGNSEGEPVVPERQIRIAEKPGTLEDDSEEESLESDLGQVGNHAFARMEGDVDKQRKQILQGQMSEAAMQKQHQRKYGSNQILK
ncbi:Ganglioside-induced differentiation-associated protein 2 [Larimichthys crocea]|uniref:Uncharacterized protein n=1 Tax=Larimichthys crocea TaxID=215358 RepID=A0ACD3QG71_LARCR|nr:Ganglioside-induced differentiation-associated protein 2 [Larimichthys crocea]